MSGGLHLHRYDPLGLRVCCVTPWSFKDQAAGVPGARWDKEWRGPEKDRPPSKVWHWPVQSMPAMLRRLPIESTEPRLAHLLARSRQINAARELTIATARRRGDALADEPTIEHSSGLRLYAHQRAAVIATLRAGGTRGLFHQTGTGKTLTSATLLSELVQPVDGLRVGVVVCPVTLVTTAWLPDLTRWFPELPVVNLRDHKKGEAREYAVQRAINQHGRCIALINYETVRTDPSVHRIMSGAYVVLDESSKIKASESGISQVIQTIAPTFRGVVALTGTPAPNAPDEYHPQAKVLASVADYDPFPGTRTAFRAEFCEPGRFGGFVFQPSMLPEMHRRLAPIAEWLRKEDCIDLPAKQFVDVPIALDPATAAQYRDMRDLMESSIRTKYGSRLRACVSNALAKVMRLRQITAGFIPAQPERWADDEGDAVDDGGPMVMVQLGTEKLDWLTEFVDDAAERVLIWTQFKFEMARCIEHFRKRKVRCDFIDGSVPAGERAPKIEAFKRGDLQLMFAHPRTMQFGVSLPGISLSVFMSCSRSAEEYLQAQDRIHGINRGDATRHSTFYRLLATADGEPTYDYDIQNCLDGKEQLQALVFKMAKEQMA